MSLDPAQSTRLLRAITDGDLSAGEQLLPLVYDELRQIAGRMVRAESRQTLQPTELIHEAYMRLIDHGDDPKWEGRQHFRRVASKAMRFVLVDRARARVAQKRGGGKPVLTLDDDAAVALDDAENVLSVHEGLERLREEDSELADVVEMRFFAGMTVEETALAMRVSASTVKRSWRVARLWWLEEFGETRRPDE